MPQGRTFYYRVKRGDTLAGIAARYAVSPADLKRWNGLTQDTVAAGQTLRITSDLAPAAGKAKRAAGASAKRAAGTTREASRHGRGEARSGETGVVEASVDDAAESRDDRAQAGGGQDASQAASQDGQAGRTSQRSSPVAKSDVGRGQLTRSPAAAQPGATALPE